MSEQLKSVSVGDLPNKVEGNYSSLGNRHTYLLGADGKKRVISRAAFTERFEQPVGDDQLIKPISGGDHTDDEDNNIAHPPAAPDGYVWRREAMSDGEGFSWKMEPVAGTRSDDTENEPATFQPIINSNRAKNAQDDDEHRTYFSNGGSDVEALLMSADAELHKEYLEARQLFTTAHANARHAGFGFLAEKDADRGGWAKSIRSKLSNRFTPNRREREEALMAFEEVYSRARGVAAAEYMSQSGRPDDEQHLAEQYLDEKEAYALEEEITGKKLASDRKKGLIRQKTATWAGAALALGAGGITAIGERMSKGEHHIGYLAVAALSGAIIGYRAEKTSRENSADYRATMLNRMSDAAGTVWMEYHPDSNASEDSASRNRQATPLYAIEKVTDAEQKRYVKRLGKAAILGGIAASGGHVLMDTGLNLAAGLFDANLNPPRSNEAILSDASPMASPTATNTPQPTHQPTSTSEAPVYASPSPESTPASTPVPTAESTPAPKPTSVPTVEPTPSPEPAAAPTMESQAPTPTPEPTPDSIPVFEPQGGVDVSDPQNGAPEPGDIPVTIWEPEVLPTVDVTELGRDASVAVVDAAREVLSSVVPVEYGNGITHEIIQYAAKNGIKLSPSQAYAIYCDYNGGTYIERLGQFTLPNGDTGIANPGTGVWNSDFKDFMDDQLGLMQFINKQAA